jgi:peptidoglycan/LPS O-acetylase OafA/YrhL
MFPGGWIGVDVFFVLSGYLITSILLNEIRETGAIAWGRFYWRRALRLTPPLVILAIFQFAHAAISSHNAAEILTATLVGIAYIENFNLVFGFAPAEHIGHLWSLATEEQFYLLWPMSLLFIARRRPLLWLVALAISMIMARIAFWAWGGGMAHQLYGPDIRPIGLLIGCALAIRRARLWPQLPTALPFACLGIMVLISTLARTGELGAAMVLAPLVSSVATAGIIMGSQQGGAISNVLSFRPAVYVGKLSYGLYLYSAPICLLGAVKGINPLILIGASVAVAALSYEFVEKPFLRLKDRSERRTSIGIPIGSGLTAPS